MQGSHPMQLKIGALFRIICLGAHAFPSGSKHWPPFIRLPTTLPTYPLEPPADPGQCPSYEPPGDDMDHQEEEEEEVNSHALLLRSMQVACMQVVCAF